MFRNNKLRYIKCILIIIFCLFSYNIRILAGEKAWIFVDDRIGFWGKYQNTPRFYKEYYYYLYAGYDVHIMTASNENILDALLDPETTAMTLIAHGGLGDVQPTVLIERASDWRKIMQKALEEIYGFENMSEEEAKLKALQESQNFGLDQFTNYSCYSSVNMEIGNLFVKPGGYYYGTPVSYNPGNRAYFYKDSDLILTEYQIKIQPSWGSGPPSEYGLNSIFHVVYPPYGGAVHAYRDGGKIWLYTNNWIKYLIHHGDGFLEFDVRDPNKATVIYERDRDQDGKLQEHIRDDGKKQWWGTTKSLDGDTVGRFYMVWESGS